MPKKLLTAGCSFTKDNYQKTWYLAQHFGYNLTNIAARGAGIDFVTNRILYACSKEKQGNQFEIVKNHPVTEAHEKWVDNILFPNL